MADALVPFLVISDVIMTLLLLLTIIYVLANFLVFITDLTISVFSALPTLREIWILPTNSTV